MNPFHNRLKKRSKHLTKWARRWPTTAWRAYDRDVPEYPWSVDLYGSHVFLQEFPNTRHSDQQRREQRAQVRDAIKELFALPDGSPPPIHERTRERQKKGAQYQKRAARQETFNVEEDGLKFQVNLDDYIDTGLFLDHRNMRREVASTVSAHGRGARMLNLFCYTGAFSVWAARAGAHTTSVDLSNTYLEWAQQNFTLNGFDPRQHLFLRQDILQWLPREAALGRRYEVIVLDPPTFSRSARMERDLDIQRDHVELLSACLELLAPGGHLYFSTNFRRFSLDEAALDAEVSEITSSTVPEDFRPGIHRAWLLRSNKLV